MSKAILSGSRGKALSGNIKRQSQDFSTWLKESIPSQLFVGLSLRGGKTNKTSLAQIEYFPKQKKIFLSQITSKLQATEKKSADEVLFELLLSLRAKAKIFAFDAPLKLPKCLRCRLVCPGAEKCQVSEVSWLRKQYKKKNLRKKPKRHFTPYTERCVEQFIASELEEKFHPSHALGANLAPLTARAHYLVKSLKIQPIEVYPKLSLWRVGRALKIQKSYLRFHKHSVSGQEAREAILKQLIENDLAFIYEDDRKLMASDPFAFDAFLCALTAVFKSLGEVEKRPSGFPKSASWIEIPITSSQFFLQRPKKRA